MHWSMHLPLAAGMKFSSSLGSLQQEELWHACAGPLVSLPPVGCPVVYFPQGHIEQVAAATNEVVDSSNLPSLPPQLVCQLHNVTMHTDEETDEVYAQMTLQTLSPEDEQKGVCVAAQAGGMRSKQPTNYFHKTLTASDTSTHGCCSIPRRAAEKVFPSLDYSQEPPAQELVAKDLHGIEWKFRHTFRGQPRRHLLTIGWTPFVNTKRLVAGDTVTFIWYGFNELLLGIRRANRQQRVASSGSMHVALVAAHAAATYSPFTVSYFPRACHSEFVIPLAKYVSAVHHVRLLGGMRFRMLFETPESTVRRYMGKIVGIGDVDPVRWPNSHWRSVKVIWDEPSAGQRQSRVSPWEIEPLPTFPLYPPHSPFCIKQPWTPGLASHLFGQSRDDDLSLSSQLTILQSYGDTTLGLQPVPNLDTIRSAVDAASWMQQKIHSLMQADPRHAMDDNAAPGVDLQTGSAAHDLPLSPSPAARLQLQHTEAAAAADLARRSTLALQSSGDEIQPGDGDGNLSQPPQTFLQIAQLVNQMRGQYSQPEPHLQYSLPPPLLAPPPPLDDACSSILQSVSSNSLTAATSYCPTDLGLFHDQSSQDILSLDPSFHATLEPLPPVAPIFFL